MYGSIVPSIVYRPTDHVRTLFPIITRTHSCLWGRRRSLCLTSNSAKANARATGDRPNEFDAFKWKCQNHQCDPLKDVFSDDFVLQFLLSSDLSFSCFFSFSFFIIIIIIFFFLLLHALLSTSFLLAPCLTPPLSYVSSSHVFLCIPFLSFLFDLFRFLLLYTIILSVSFSFLVSLSFLPFAESPFRWSDPSTCTGPGGGPGASGLRSRLMIEPQQLMSWVMGQTDQHSKIDPFSTNKMINSFVIPFPGWLL